MDASRLAADGVAGLFWRSDGRPRLGVVVIGRNEAPRLGASLTSIAGRNPCIYVDSGSTDASVAIARSCGALLVELDPVVPFTAGHARNVGLDALLSQHPSLDYVQFLDGDAALRCGWLAEATAFLDDHPQVAAVFGRLRERNPDASIYNRLCDAEWDTPLGPSKACGGIAMMRVAALRETGAFRDGLIAGEEPELCLRMRRRGWQIWRIDREMAWHDAAMYRFSQWWRRTRRSGFAFAQGAALHGRAPERHWVRETRRAVCWALLPPSAAVLLALVHPAGLLVLLAYPVQAVRLALREGPRSGASWKRAALTVLGRLAETQGVLDFHLRRALGRGAQLIEYK